MGQLQVNTDVALNAAHAVSSDAEELRQELSGLEQKWQDVSHGWSGAAATSFTSLWDEWHEGALTIIDVLAESSRDLAQAAVLYAQQDASAAQSLSHITPPPFTDEMGL